MAYIRCWYYPLSFSLSLFLILLTIFISLVIFPSFLGARACAGTHLATPVLKVLMSQLVTSKKFQPLIEHRYSGRHLDGTLGGDKWCITAIYESCYFLWVVVSAFIQALCYRE